MNIVTREEAKDHGLARFFTGKPCINGHFSERRTANGKCIACDLEQQRLSHAKNPVAAQARCRTWRENNPEKMKESAQNWRKNNIEYARKLSRDNIARLRKENPESIRISERKKRAKRCAAEGSHTSTDIFDIYRMQKGRCAYCRVLVKKDYHVDHIMALSRGGTNYRNNLQILCPRCNISKHAAEPIKFAQSLGKLL